MYLVVVIPLILNTFQQSICLLSHQTRSVSLDDTFIENIEKCGCFVSGVFYDPDEDIETRVNESETKFKVYLIKSHSCLDETTFDTWIKNILPFHF